MICNAGLSRASILAAFLMIMIPSVPLAQELEPNDPCAFAQAENASSLPFLINGSLDSSESIADVDFFRFTGNPGETIRVDLEGASTGAGWLSDPYLGLFDADCVLQTVNDDGGIGLNSQLLFEVPPAGEFVLGVSNCCDYDFVGGGLGSYLLSLTPVVLAGSVAGALEDAETGAPLPGDAPPFAYVELYRCSGSDCYDFEAAMQADSSGGFAFTSVFDGLPLQAGAYQLRASAQGYQPLLTAPFDVSENQHLDLGAVQLEPLPIIGSVSGRLVDELDRIPLSGQAPPFAAAILARCEEFGCYSVAYAGADETGRFRFDGSIHQVPAGDYMVVGQADGFEPSESARVTIARNEAVDLGDIRLLPIPIRFGEVHYCEITEGRVCRYGIDITVRVGKRLKAEAWSIVQFIPVSVPGPSASFQVGRLGVSNPMPQQLNLKAGDARSLMFELAIPGQVPDSFLMCASIAIGAKPDAQFNLIAEQPLFCALKESGELNLLSENEARSAWRQHRQQ